MAKNEESLSFLLSLYQKREDLQDSFPEVESKDYQALINWAAGVSSKRWKDTEVFLSLFMTRGVSREF